MADINKEELKKQMEFDRNMNLANGFRSKGDYKQAEEMLISALSLFPENMDAREFAADILMARGELEKAADHYKSLFTTENPRPSAEEKYARAIVQIAEAKRQRTLLDQMLENPAKFRNQTANPYLAALLSIAPGFGHIYAGKFKKGVTLFCVALFCWLMIYLLTPTVDQSLGLQTRASNFINGLFAFPTILFVLTAGVVGVYSIFDAAFTTDKERRKQTGAP